MFQKTMLFIAVMVIIFFAFLTGQREGFEKTENMKVSLVEFHGQGEVWGRSNRGEIEELFIEIPGNGFSVSIMNKTKVFYNGSKVNGNLCTFLCGWDSVVGSAQKNGIRMKIDGEYINIDVDPPSLLAFGEVKHVLNQIHITSL